MGKGAEFPAPATPPGPAKSGRQGCSGGQATWWPAICRLPRAKTKNQVALKQGFRQCWCQASPSYPKLTQVQGPESGAQRPRKPPAFRPSPWPPPDLHPLKSCPPHKPPANDRPAPPGSPTPGSFRPLSAEALRREDTANAPPPPAQPPGPHPSSTHAPTQAPRGIISPQVPGAPGAGSSDLHAGRTCRPCPNPSATASPRPPAAGAATPARPAPSLLPLPPAGSGPHSGSRDRSFAGCPRRHHFPTAPRLRVPGATSAKACAPRWESRPGRSACWEL